MLSVGFGSREAARPIHTELRLIQFSNIFIYPLLSAKVGPRAGRDSAASFRLNPARPADFRPSSGLTRHMVRRHFCPEMSEFLSCRIFAPQHFVTKTFVPVPTVPRLWVPVSVRILGFSSRDRKALLFECWNSSFFNSRDWIQFSASQRFLKVG